jgi:hypothetical protein
LVKDLNTQIHLLFNLTTGSAITEIKQTHEKCFYVLTASNKFQWIVLFYRYRIVCYLRRMNYSQEEE